MKKSLIALTLAALPVAAVADVTLYGQVKAGVETSQVKLGSGTATAVGATKTKTNSTQITDLSSRIGFKGHEHLGNNLNAIWQIEQGTAVSGSTGWATRDSFIGLEGNFGKVRAGKLSTAVKDTVDSSDDWEYNNSALGLAAFTRTGTREISVRYDSPIFAGFSANVQYSPRDNGNTAEKTEWKQTTANPNGEWVTTPAQRGQDKFFAGVNYENSGYFAQVGAGYAKNATTDKNGKAKDGQVYAVTGGYDANDLKVSVGVQHAKNWETLDEYAEATANGAADTAAAVYGTANANGGNGVTTTEATATVAYRFGNVTPRISYAHGFKAEAADGEKIKGSEYNQVVVGADYDFSKRTSALVSAGWMNSGLKGNHKVEQIAGQVGLRHKF